MQTIGERLEEARKRKGISIREAAEATKIRGDYLHKYESNQFDIKLPEIYVRGFLRTYANYLKLSGDKILNDYSALGLTDSKGVRTLNREVYGRMDLTVATATKTPEETRAAPSAAAAALTPGGDQIAPQNPHDRNPATFRPRAPGGLPIDRDLLIKGGLALGALIVVIVLGAWGVSALMKPGTPVADAPQPVEANPTGDVWIKPRTGETQLAFFALDTVTVTVVRLSDNGVLFRGTLAANENRTVPRTGMLRVTADPFKNLELGIDGVRHAMPGSRSADIKAPAPALPPR